MRQIKQQLLLTVTLLLCSIGIANAEIYKGSCGYNVTYSLDTETGELNIDGRGAMYYWTLESAAPWYSNRYYIKSASISDGVTSIGNYAFFGCSALTSVTIPNSVTSIGSSAFQFCSSLTSVTIPNSVTSIGSNAFYGCSGLTKAEFASIESLCKISFSTQEANPLSYAKHLYVDGSEVKDLVIPNSVTSIKDFAFSGCSGLTSVTIPNSVTSIKDFAFSGCSGLTSVTIPNSVTSIGNSAFSGCSGLTSVTIPNSVTSIASSAFYYCSGLTSVTIPNSVTSIASSAFYYCSGLTSVVWNAKKCNDFSAYNHPFPTTVENITFGDEVESIPAYLCYNLSSLTSVTIGNSVTLIGSSAFQGCSGLTSVVWNAKKCNDLYYPFPTTVKSITFGDEVEYIPARLCYNMTSLTSVTIPNSVTSIGGSAFEGCSGLTSVTIPNSVTSIGESAFYRCSGLTSVTIGNSVTSIGNYTFSDCSFVKNIINLSSAPQSNAGSLPTTATVHVLKGCKSVYSTSSAWRNYNIVEDAEKFFPLESVSFEKEKMYVKMGSVFKLTPMIEPSIAPASIYDLIWMSSDPSVLYLDQNTQRLTAMKEGTATVTVTAIDANDNMKSAQVTVYVGDGIDPEESGDPQCDAPIVKYTNGNIICVSATDNAVCHYTCRIMGESEGEDTGSSAGIPLKIEITAYATAEGYRQSKNTVKTFDYVPTGSGLKGDVNGDGAVTMQDANEVVNIYLGGK